MDSRVGSISTKVEQLQDQQQEQLQCIQASLQSTAALEQRLLQAKQRRLEEAA